MEISWITTKLILIKQNDIRSHPPVGPTFGFTKTLLLVLTCRDERQLRVMIMIMIMMMMMSMMMLMMTMEMLSSEWVS